MKNLLIALSVLFFLSAPVSAGLFGPDNYEECVLDKMKGQIKSMTATARKACEKQFPYEKQLDYYLDNIEWFWSNIDQNVFFSITKNYGEYDITRVSLNLTLSPCAKTNINENKPYTAMVELKKTRNVYSGSHIIDSKLIYSCARVAKIWGIIRR